VATWCINDNNIVKNKFKKYQKNHKEDTASVFANLLDLIDFLNSGISFRQVLQNRSYLKNEKGHVYRIANKNALMLMKQGFIFVLKRNKK